MTSLPIPHLDDRRFQDLVDEAKRFIQRRCPEWTDHNVSDPGVALIEAFAQMVDQLSYRINRVPEKIHLEFLDLLGVQLTPPQAATAELTFWLSAPQNTQVTVPAGTEVATPRTGDEPVITFTVDHQLDIVPTQLIHIGSASSGQPPELLTEHFESGQQATCFTPRPVPGDTFLVGLDRPAPRCTIALRVDCSTDGVGVDPRHPPRVWEAWCADRWVECQIGSDTTGGLNRPGEILLHLPEGHSASLIGRRRAAWLRCRVTETFAGQPAYSASPKVSALEACTVGGTTNATEGEPVPHDELGRSDGTPGQTFRVHRAPAVSGSLRTVVVETRSGCQTWHTVSSFTNSTAESRHVTVDEVSGTVRFGPAVRQPDGAIRQYGAVPEIGARITAGPYRRGGGRTGNLAASTLTVLRTPLALISRVENRIAASGGVDAESVEGVRRRAAHSLRTQHRAVTAKDYQSIVAEACPQAGRIECLIDPTDTKQPNLVRVLLVPQTGNQIEEDRQQFVPSQALLSCASQAVEATRPLGVSVAVSGPSYQGVTVVAEVEAARKADRRAVQASVLHALNTCLNPLPSPHGGPGWPLGRALRVGDLYAVVARCEDVAAVSRLEIYPADIATGERQSATDRINLGPTALFLSFRHEVAVTSDR
ncbi:putative baseplate assembly protein [Streptomyces sp. MS2.AVA.5]|uniref:Baseplate assembly protein n=1 Tax=Streptomyces achmelvichensis TaxID=3134111 RepID=A0ACC6PL75_9ACTN